MGTVRAFLFLERNDTTLTIVKCTMVYGCLIALLHFYYLSNEHCSYRNEKKTKKLNENYWNVDHTTAGCTIPCCNPGAFIAEVIKYKLN